MSRNRMSPADLEQSLTKSFIAGVSWPIDGASLAALSDMGFGPEEIAGMFDVAPAEVRRLYDGFSAPVR